jgi:purine-cytosine permease-like protein
MATVTWQDRREDYALQVVPESYRTWSWPSLFGVLLSVPTALIYLTLGGTLVLTYGFKSLLIAMIISTLFMGSVGYILTRATARAGLDTDLISISSGFGYKGSGVTSFIYAANFPLFFALEGSIMADAIHAEFPAAPFWSLYVALGVIFMALSWYGITIMNYVMWVTLPVYLALLIWTIIRTLAVSSPVDLWTYSPSRPPNLSGGPVLLQILAAASGFIINAINSGDIGRMIQGRQRHTAAIAIGFGYEAVTFLGATLLGAWLAVRLGKSNPGVYIPALIGAWGTVFIVVSQLRINVLNTYSGSLAFANFFWRIFNFKPGRHLMAVLVIILSIGLMIFGVLNRLTEVLSFEGIFTIAWIMAITAYIAINKTLLGIERQSFYIDKEKSPRYNLVGLTSLAVALAVSVPLALGAAGPFGRTIAPFISAGIAFAFVSGICLAIWLRNRLST